MDLRTVRKDRHGLYVKADLRIFRPEREKHEADYVDRTYVSQFPEGTKVTTRVVSQTSHCRLNSTGFDWEVWVSHGSYTNGYGIHWDSETIWDPRNRNMKKYKVTWTEKHEFTTEAESAEDAMEEAEDMGTETFVEGSDGDLMAVLIEEK